MSVTDDIKQRLDIVSLIGESGVALRKSGRNFAGFCPFHTNTRTPSFYVFPATQSYYCFGCHVAGDAFNYVMAQQGLQFADALRTLANRAGVQLEERTPQQEQEDATRAKLRQINHDAATYWNHVLQSTGKGQAGREYVEKRGLSAGTVETWLLGYAPDAWSDLLVYLTDRKGYTPEEVEQAGLVIKRDGGGYYDRFRNRVMFPIRNIKGEIVGFGGRTLGDDGAKYMNSPETPLFHKSHVLYGIDLARDAMRQHDTVVFVEGYMDVLMAHQAGFSNVVAPMGTALTGEQVNIVKRLARTVYLALDADDAGIKATLKGLDTLREHMDATHTPVPTSSGAIKWERELDGEIKIITLPEGRDPDEVLRDDPQQWQALVDAALPLMDYYVAQLTRDLDLGSARGRTDAVERLSPLIAELGNLVQRAHYTQQLAHKVGLSEDVIRVAVAQHRRGQDRRGLGRKEERPGAQRVVVPQPWTREDHLLSLLLRFPDAQPAVERTLAEHTANAPDVDADLHGTLAEAWTHIENQQLWQSWQAFVADGHPRADVWLGQLDPYLRPRAERLIQHTDTPALPVVGRRQHVELLACKIATELRWTIVKHRINQLKAMSEGIDDVDAQRALIGRVDALNRYQNVVTAPRRSTIYADLGRHREAMGS
jgi:DNA primase